MGYALPLPPDYILRYRLPPTQDESFDTGYRALRVSLGQGRPPEHSERVEGQS